MPSNRCQQQKLWYELNSLCIHYLGFLNFHYITCHSLHLHNLCSSRDIHLKFSDRTRFWYLAGRICNKFEKNHAFYDNSMKLGTCLVGTNTKKLRISVMRKMSCSGRHLDFFTKWRPIFSLFNIISLYIPKYHVFYSQFYLYHRHTYLYT